MKTPEELIENFIENWNVGHEDKEQKIEFAEMMREQLKALTQCQQDNDNPIAVCKHCAVVITCPNCENLHYECQQDNAVREYAVFRDYGSDLVQKSIWFGTREKAVEYINDAMTPKSNYIILEKTLKKQ